MSQDTAACASSVELSLEGAPRQCPGDPRYRARSDPSHVRELRRNFGVAECPTHTSPEETMARNRKPAKKTSKRKAATRKPATRKSATRKSATRNAPGRSTA